MSENLFYIFGNKIFWVQMITWFTPHGDFIMVA